MSQVPSDVPIIFVIFNRPQLIRLVFDVIRQVKPSRLFIIADGYDGYDEIVQGGRGAFSVSHSGVSFG